MHHGKPRGFFCGHLGAMSPVGQGTGGGVIANRSEPAGSKWGNQGRFFCSLSQGGKKLGVLGHLCKSEVMTNISGQFLSCIYIYIFKTYFPLG